ncbi:MAG: ABC-F family ATP-binding cassette domain-containing protein [Inquilinaceae bacterium]
MLQIADLTYRIAGRILLDNATVSVPEGHRVSLIGPNGAGKTTLLRLILGDLHPDGGGVSMPRRWRVGTVAQEAPGGNGSLIDTVLAADTERSALLAEADRATDPTRIADIHARLVDIDAHAAPARAASILAGLGFDHQAQQRPCGALSGGMRMRVALAATLFAQPDLLLLDEPTNHLDLEATLWLEAYLKSYPGTLLIISHDRDLLNAIPETTIHLEDGKLVPYGGGYDRFEETRRLRLAHMAALQARQTAQRAHMQAFVDRFRYKASKARQAQSRLKALAKMEPIASVAEARTIQFDFPEPEPLSPPLITLNGVAVGYNGTPVLKGLNLRIDTDDRIGLLGANGNGKSTLVKLLAGRLQPLVGDMGRSGKLKIGYFAQHQTDELDVAIDPLTQALRWRPGSAEQKLRSHLGRFGFSQDRARTPIGSLSGGEKARLLFALMCLDAPHVLLLDEPTNHLDVDSRQALVQALAAFNGAVILISHDPHLISLSADRLWLVADGACRPFDGDLDDYRRLLIEQRRSERASARSGANGGERQEPTLSRKEQRRAAAEARAALAEVSRKAKEAEAAIVRLTAEKKTFEARLADPSLYQQPAEAVTKVRRALADLDKRLAAAEATWLEAQEKLEMVD